MDFIKKWFYFIIGVLINSFGIALITKGALGTSPISSVPYVLSLQFPSFSFGMTLSHCNSCNLVSIFSLAVSLILV